MNEIITEYLLENRVEGQQKSASDSYLIFKIFQNVLRHLKLSNVQEKKNCCSSLFYYMNNTLTESALNLRQTNGAH